jgi:hypothetical protein
MGSACQSALMLDELIETDTQQEVPLDATLAHGAPKSSVSRFKAGRAARARPAEPTEISAQSHVGSTTTARAQPSAVRRAIRTGKLENGKLVGPAEDSASEDEEAQARELIDMLQRGELSNLGPNPLFVPGSVGDPGPSTIASAPSSARPPVSSGSVKERTKHPLLAQLSQSSQSPSPSPLPTPITMVGRSSPKMESAPIPTPVGSRVVERAPQARGNPIAVPTKNSKPPERVEPAYTPDVEYPAQTSVMPSMIVDSPSFPRPGESQPVPPDSTAQARKPSRFMQSRQ